MECLVCCTLLSLSDVFFVAQVVELGALWELLMCAPCVRRVEVGVLFLIFPWLVEFHLASARDFLMGIIFLAADNPQLLNVFMLS